jgi:hypothetical protein
VNKPNQQEPQIQNPKGNSLNSLCCVLRRHCGLFVFLTSVLLAGCSQQSGQQKPLPVEDMKVPGKILNDMNQVVQNQNTPSPEGENLSGKTTNDTALMIQSHNKRSFWNDDVTKRLVWGYVDRHSIKPGQNFNVMLSTDFSDKSVQGHLEVYRIGNYPDGDRIRVWESSTITVQEHELYDTAGIVGPAWPVSVGNIPTKTWQSGYYTIDFIDRAGKRDADIAYIVVTPAQLNGDILVKLSTNTYQAYNEWGGSSFYKSRFTGTAANMVTFDRPTPSHFFKWEYYYVLWLEPLAQELGLTVHYTTDFDIHLNAEYTKNYPLVISVGHDEYWTKEEFTHMYDRIFVHGKNTLFLGANTAYWQIRYADVNATLPEAFQGRQMVCFKHNVDPIYFKTGQDPILDATGKFRDGNRRSEIMLMGVSYQSYFPSGSNQRYPYYVATDQIRHPLFARTGYRRGDAIGDVIGHEWDNTDPSPQKNRYWEERNSHIPFLPKEKILVLFSGHPVDKRGHTGKAEAVYFESDAGGKVFSSGTIRWPWGLTKEGFQQEPFKQFNRNLIEVFLKDSSSKPTQYIIHK